MTLVATVAGTPVGVDDVDAREAVLRDAPQVAALPRPGTSEGRQLRRWLTQLLVTERVVAREAAALGVTVSAATPTEDELLLALIDTIMAESTKQWREDTADLPAAAAMRLLIDRICTPAETTRQDSINRGLTFYNDHLAETLPQEYARVLSPLHELIQEILERGIAEGTFRGDLEMETTAALMMQAVLGAMRLRSLGVELNGIPIEADHIFDFCVRGLLPGSPD